MELHSQSCIALYSEAVAGNGASLGLLDWKARCLWCIRDGCPLSGMMEEFTLVSLSDHLAYGIVPGLIAERQLPLNSKQFGIQDPFPAHSSNVLGVWQSKITTSLAGRGGRS